MNLLSLSFDIWKVLFCGPVHFLRANRIVEALFKWKNKFFFIIYGQVQILLTLPFWHLSSSCRLVAFTELHLVSQSNTWWPFKLIPKRRKWNSYMVRNRVGVCPLPIVLLLRRFLGRTCHLQEVEQSTFQNISKYMFKNTFGIMCWLNNVIFCTCAGFVFNFQGMELHSNDFS